jgi:hypothetical protein
LGRWRILVPFSPIGAGAYLLAITSFAWLAGVALWEPSQRTFGLLNILVAVAFGVGVGIVRPDGGDDDDGNGSPPSPSPHAPCRSVRVRNPRRDAPSRKPSRR